MKKKSAGNTKIRKEHTRIVLNFIRKYAPVSRTDIYEKTKISKPTVTRVIENLIKDGILTETGVGSSAVGRKPVYVKLNTNAYFCIGVNITLNAAYISLIDLGMNILDSIKVSIKGLKDTTDFLNVVTDAVEGIIKGNLQDREKLLGIGIGAPGLVDYQRGIILDFGLRHSMYDIPLQSHLEDRTGLKTLIDNNANTRALGEYWYGYGEGYRNIIYVVCSQGVGSGIIADGRILRGKNNVSGEFGHMTVNIDGRKCICGKYGCIEAYCSLDALEEITREALKMGKESTVLDKTGGDIESINYRHICQSAYENDVLCIQKLEETACILGTGLANLAGVFNTEIVILSGELFDESDYFYERVVEMTSKNIFSPLAQEIVFKRRKVEDNLYEIGAATLIFKDFFKD